MSDMAAGGPTPSTSAGILCIVCHTQPSKYTCPRCHTKTCSASCSNAHKVMTACSGARDRAGYIPMNSYGWGSMMDDYVFLEDVGRVVETQGTLIARDGLTRGSRGRARGRGAGEAGARRGKEVGKSKREILQMQLSFKSIRMDMLPEGMQRQRSNMSRFDTRNNTISLSCEIVLYTPYPSTTALPDGKDLDVYKFLVHSSAITAPLREIVSKHLTRISDAHHSGKNMKHALEKLPSWLQWYIHALDTGSVTMISGGGAKADEIAGTSFRALLPEYPARPLRRPVPNLGVFAPSAASSNRDVLKAYHLVDPAEPLQSSLRGRAFLEFPTYVFIPASHDEANDAVIFVEDVPDDGVVLRGQKRQRVDDGSSSVAPPPAKRIATILDAYSSDEDTRASKNKSDNALGLLGGYDSDGSEPPTRDEDSDAEDDADEPDVDMPLVSPVDSDTPLASKWLIEQADDEEVDWGEDVE